MESNVGGELHHSTLSSSLTTRVVIHSSNDVRIELIVMALDCDILPFIDLKRFLDCHFITNSNKQIVSDVGVCLR